MRGVHCRLHPISCFLVNQMTKYGSSDTERNHRLPCERVRIVCLQLVPGWELTGAVTFYESPVTFSRCEFSRSRSEDALNVIRGEPEALDHARAVLADARSRVRFVQAYESDSYRDTVKKRLEMTASTNTPIV